MIESKVWVITGTSKGLGLATVKYLLAKGQKVIATTRDREKFDHSLITNPNLEVIALDITNETEVERSINSIIKKYERIDVLINNAGYGFAGAVEEASNDEFDQIMQVNVYATLRMIRYILPVMRKAKKGHIINFSSVAGLVSAPGFGIYNATKYAIEGFTEALNYEVRELGIKVTLIEPGAFRTSFLDNSLIMAKKVISDYDTTAGKTRINLVGGNGKQGGNPDRAVEEVVKLVEMENPPLRLLLGEDAYKRATNKLKDLEVEFERMKEVTLSTGYEVN